MTSLVEIKKAIIDKLKPLGVNIIASEIQSGFKKPAFFVQLMVISEESDADMNVNTLTVNIHYFSEDKTDLDNLKMIDTLRKLFVVTLKTDSRTLTLSDKRHDIYDNVLQFKFDIRYTDTNIVEEHEPMQDIEVNQNI